jgi:hypothetical protein
MHAAKRAAGPRAQRAGGVVEARRDAGEARVHALKAHGEEAHRVGEEQPHRRAGEEEAHRPAGEARERRAHPVVERGQRDEDADRDHRARQRIAQRGEARRPAGGARRVEPSRIGQHDGEQAGEDGGDGGEPEGIRQKRPQVPRHPTLGPRARGPERELAHRQQEGEASTAAQVTVAAAARAPRRTTGAASAPRRSRWVNRCCPREPRSSASSAPAQRSSTLARLGGGHAIEHPVPDAVDPFGQGAIAEGGHGAEVAQRLHHRQRHAGGERRSRQRQRDRENARSASAEAAGGLERGRALARKAARARR